MNLLLGLLIIGAVLWAYASFMEFAFKKAVAAAGCSPSENNPAPPATIQTSILDFCLPPAPALSVQGEAFDTHVCANEPVCSGDCRMAHMQWAKQRALDLLPDVHTARASFMSDLGKSAETEGVLMMFAEMLMFAPFNECQFRSFIEGFGEGVCDCKQTETTISDHDLYEQVMVALNNGGEEE